MPDKSITRPTMPIDPALEMYSPFYTYQQPPAPSYPSPSSQSSDTMGTPSAPTAGPSTNANGKRSAADSSGLGASNDARKKQRMDSNDDTPSPTAEKEEPKPKSTRGSRACTVCRRLKMKCVGAEQGPPCQRCLTGNHECIFEESNRGKRSANTKKHELLTRSLRKMERTLDTVLRSIGNPSIASGMISRSTSPTAQQTLSTQALLDSPSPPPSSSQQLQLVPSHAPPGSPKLHSLPDNTLNPLGLLAEASLANRRVHAQHNPTSMLPVADTSPGGPRLGVASDNYFKPGPMTILPLRRLYIERQIQPEMLSFVTTEQVVALFNIYFDHINTHCSLLDRSFHTPSLVCSRSPFLLTAICSISAKFYTEKPELHGKLTELAKKLAFSVPAQGYKSVEIVQAYLLLSLWGCGAVERYEQDKTWMLLGMGIRMATDLNLHRKTTATSQDTLEGKARETEVHNRVRTWLMCFCLDRSLSNQTGKPSSIKEDDIIRNALKWCQQPSAIPTDRSLACYVEFQKVLSRSLEFLHSASDSSSGLLTNIDYPLVTKTMEAQLTNWRDESSAFIAASFPNHSAPDYMLTIATFYFNYGMLVINSFGLHNALHKTPINLPHFFGRCHSAAMTCALLVRDELGPRDFLKYSPDSHFVQTSYAVLSLLKMIRPELQVFQDNEKQAISLVLDVATTFERVAANSHHTPALYATFLRALIASKLDRNQSSSSSQQQQQGTLNISGPNFSRDQTEMPPPHLYNQTMQGGQPMMNGFHLEGEMGPVSDISTFPPQMAQPGETDFGNMPLDSILSSQFWDSMLMPTMEGLSGGFVYGAGGSGLITPSFGMSPIHSGANTPLRGSQHMSELSQHAINNAFDNSMGQR